MRRIVLLMLLMSTAAQAAAQHLTLEECMAMALENNNRIGIARAGSEQAAGTKRSYLANFFPKLSVTGTYVYNDSETTLAIPGGYLPTFVSGPEMALNPDLYAFMPDISMKLGMRGVYVAGVQAEQPLFTGGRMVSAYRLASLAEDMAELGERKARAEVIVAVEEAYWMYVKADRLALSAAKYGELVAELLRVMEEANRNGLKSKNDLLKIRVKMNEAELHLRQAGNAAALARMNLCHEVGLPPTSGINVGGDRMETVLEALPEADMESRPEYMMMDRQVDMKLQQVRLARSEFLPSAGVQANYNYACGLKLNGREMLDKGFFSGLVSVNIPIFHWGEGRGKVKAAKAERMIAGLQREELAQKLELDLAQCRNACDEASLEVALTLRSLEQAEENLRVSGEHYKAGMETLSDLLEAQAMWQKADADLINARAAQMLAMTKYKRAAGKL